MEKIKFKDRISKYPNRKKLKIISQNENEILADVVPADDAQVEGTELNAKILNKWQDVISTSEGNAMLAKNKVHIAEENAKLAVKYSKEAIAKAEQAEMVADYVSKSVNNTFIPIKTSELFNDNQFVSAKPQTLTDEEKSQARENIGAGTSNFSGNYEDLTNKPNIPSYDNVPTKDYIDEKISNLVNSAPETLDTLGEIASALQENDSLITTLNTAITNKVDKVAGKGLSTNDFTDEEKAKLLSVEDGAEKNVQSNWSEEDITSAEYIKNKPSIPTKLSDLTQDVDYLITESDPTVPSWAKQSSKPTYTYSEIQNTPSTLPNPNNLTIKDGTTTLATYNGSNAVEIDLSSKADVSDIPTATSDLSNDSNFVNLTTLNSFSVLPAENYILFSPSNGMTLTAPANGWYTIYCNTSSDGCAVGFVNQTNNLVSVTRRISNEIGTSIPVKQGDQVLVRCEQVNNVWDARFVYADKIESILGGGTVVPL
ncbi:MAG TPA: hypothetical protein IAB72_03410 [Candidatus Onthoplasma faecipullorum]|nr:hypothetical protein [Candidatus Onthoplasma faecipullorum]